MEDRNGFSGVSFNNLRKALYLIYFGVDPIYNEKGEIIGAKSQDFNSPKYRYIVPMQGNFDNPLFKEEELNKDTFIEYWISEDKSLTQDDYTTDKEGEAVNRQKCVANVLIRFIGREADTWVRVLRHLTKRNDVFKIFEGVCNAKKLEYTMPIIPRKVNYFGKNSQIAFDIRFKLYYDECIRTNWLPLEGINFKVEGKIYVDDKEV